MPALKLIYFPVRARAEMIRMALAHGQIPYEDALPQDFYGKTWAEGAKAETPYGSVPVMIVDGQPLAQTAAIMRYVSRMAGLLPEDTWLAAKCDAVFEATQELVTGAINVNPIVNVFKGDAFEDKKKAFFEAFPAKLANLEKAIGDGAGDGPFFFGTRPYYCDLAAYHVFDLAKLLEPTALDGHPKAVELMKAVEALPGVGGYLKTRPAVVGIGTAPKLAGA